MFVFQDVCINVFEFVFVTVPQFSLEAGCWQQNSNEMLSILHLLIVDDYQEFLGGLISLNWAVDDCIVLHELLALAQGIRCQIDVCHLFHFSSEVLRELPPTSIETLIKRVRVSIGNILRRGSGNCIMMLQD